MGPPRTLIPNPQSSIRQPVGVMLLVSDLEHGGAQRQVVQLARSLDRSRFHPVVCCLSDHVPLASNLPDPDRDLVIVKRGWRFDATTVWKLARVLKQRNISIVHAFLFDAEVAARLGGRLARVPIVIGSERNSDYQRSLIQSICLRLTRGMFDAVIANSRAGKRFVIDTQGVDDDRIHVVYNGVDVNEFRPFDASETRRRLGIGEGEPVVGMVASYKPQKNHLMFLQCGRRIAKSIGNVRFLLVGGQLGNESGKTAILKPGTGIHKNVGQYYQQVMRTMGELELRERCVLVKESDELPSLYNVCDVTVLTSRHEGTPNVLLESMACGVPVVATNVADNAFVVPSGEVGYHVDVDDADGMAEKVCGLLSRHEERRRMGAAARAWVERQFSTSALARNTEAVYAELLAGKRSRRGH
ncbi:MAG: glycosyltransferase [Phycisphaerae bacterium]